MDFKGTPHPISSANGGFGSDTIIQLPNSDDANVSALELVTSLTTATADAEVSQLVISLLNAGVQVAGLTIKPGQILAPIGTIALPGMAFQSHASSGLSYDVGTSGIFLSLAGVQRIGFISATPDIMLMQYDAAVIQMGSLQQGIFGMTGLTAQVASTLGDVVIGTLAALATDATTGFLQIPTCAGAPTGTIAQLKTGKVGLVYNTTDKKIAITTGGGTWVQTAALA